MSDNAGTELLQERLTTPQQDSLQGVPEDISKARTPLIEEEGKKEKLKPRTVTFGSVEVTENLGTNLLTTDERHIYQTGFYTLQALVSRTEASEEKHYDTLY